MQKSSPAKKRPSTASSPNKVTKTTTTINDQGQKVTRTTTTQKFTTTHLSQGDYDQLQLLLKEKEIELNNKLSLLVGMQEKQAVMDEIQKDLEENQRMIRETDAGRQELQIKFDITCQKLDEDTEMKTKFTESLRDEIKQLKHELEERNRASARREQEHIDQMARRDQQHTNELNRLTQQHTEEMKNLKLEHAQVLEMLRREKQEKIDTLEINLRKCQDTIVNLESTVLSLNTVIAKKEDVEKERDLWINRHNDMEQQKQDITVQLQGASEYIFQLENKCYEVNQEQLEMLKQLKGHESEIDNLRQYIIDLKSRIAVYIPVKGDVIDKKLAEYINNYPDRQKLKIMFMRESEGVYQFGTKRVYVKCVKEKIEIKVGGGFLSLDEFLDQYTPTELEKLERKDPVKRMTDRIALQKTIKGTAVREEASPNRGQSPQRKKTAV